MNANYKNNDDLANCMTARKRPEARNMQKELTPYNPNWRQENKAKSIAQYARLNATAIFPENAR